MEFQLKVKYYSVLVLQIGLYVCPIDLANRSDQSFWPSLTGHRLMRMKRSVARKSNASKSAQPVVSQRPADPREYRRRLPKTART